MWSQKLPDWIAAHVRAFAYFGGVARQTVSDNLKAGITKACFHEPTVNRTYADLARHYGTAIVPARPYKPRDKYGLALEICTGPREGREDHLRSTVAYAASIVVSRVPDAPPEVPGIGGIIAEV